MPGQPHRMWKVYFPQYCLTSPSGICLGWVCTKRQLICILGIAHATIRDLSDHLSNLTNDKVAKVEPVGLWLNNGSDSDTGDVASFTEDAASFTEDAFRDRAFELILNQQSYDDIPDCQMFVRNKGIRSTQQSALFILYDKNQLIDSKLGQWGTHSSHFNKQINHNTKLDVVEEDRVTDIEKIFHTVQRSFPTLCHLKAKGKLNLSCEIWSEKENYWTRFAGNMLWHLFCIQLRVLFTVLHFLFDNRYIFSCKNESYLQVGP